MQSLQSQTATRKLQLPDGLPHVCHALLGPMTWYGVGGRAAVLARPLNVEQLAALVRRCRDDGVAVYVLGSGANLLVADEGVDGVVVRLDARAFSQVRIEGTGVTAGAGCDLRRLVLDTAKAGLGGLACMAGIPASVGGAVRMNAGGAFGEIGRCVRRVRVLDDAGNIVDLDRRQIQFGYRHTSITAPFILEAEFDLTPGDPAALRARVKEIFDLKTGTQPLAAHSAGCTFKNPPPGPTGKVLPAGMLIDRAGLKGHAIGGASVSRHHANFIVCGDGCTAGHVIALMQHVEQAVHQRFGVRLQREVVVWS